MEVSELRFRPAVRTELRPKRTANWRRLVSVVLPLLLGIAGSDIRNFVGLIGQEIRISLPMVVDLKIDFHWAVGSSGSPQVATPDTNNRESEHTATPPKRSAEPAKLAPKAAKRRVCSPSAARRC